MQRRLRHKEDTGADRGAVVQTACCLSMQAGGPIEAAVAEMRRQLRSGIAAAETALRPPPPLAAPEREPLIVISSAGHQTADPCCQVGTLQSHPSSPTVASTTADIALVSPFVSPSGSRRAVGSSAFMLLTL